MKQMQQFLGNKYLQSFADTGRMYSDLKIAIDAGDPGTDQSSPIRA